MAIGSKHPQKFSSQLTQQTSDGEKVKSSSGGRGGKLNLWTLAFFALCLVPFVMVLGNSMLIPVFPRLKEELSLSQMQVGLLVTAFSLPAGLLIPFAGLLSDRIGRKKIIVIALTVYGIGGLIAGLASMWLERPFLWVVVGRVIQGIGAGGTYQLAMALAGDIYGKENLPKALGALEASNGLGKMASPILGSIFMAIIWYLPFFVYGIFSLPTGLLVALAVKEPNPGGEQETFQKYIAAVKEIVKRKGISLLVTFLVGFIAFFMLFGVLSYLSDVLEQEFNLYNVRKGLALAIPTTVMTVTTFASGVFLQKRKHLLKPAIIVGMAVTTAALLATPIFDNPLYFFGVVVLIGLGMGLVLPPLNTLITGAASSDERGVITALYGTVRFFGVAAGPPTFGAIGFDNSWLFTLAAAASGIAGVLAFFLVDSKLMLSGESEPAN